MSDVATLGVGVMVAVVATAWGLASGGRWWLALAAVTAAAAWWAGTRQPLVAATCGVEVLAMAVLWSPLGAGTLLERRGRLAGPGMSLAAGQVVALYLALQGPGLAWWPSLALALAGLSRLLLPGRPGQLVATLTLASLATVAAPMALPLTSQALLLTSPLLALALMATARRRPAA